MSKHWITGEGNKITLHGFNGRFGEHFGLFIDGPRLHGIYTQPDLMDATSRLQAEEIVQQYGDRNGWRTEEEEEK
jgi:hypothetical protein